MRKRIKNRSSWDSGSGKVPWYSAGFCVAITMTEVKAAQTQLQQLQQEVVGYQDLFTKVAEIASEVGGYDSQIKTIAGELISKGTQLEKLATSFREVAAALKTITKSSPNP